MIHQSDAGLSSQLKYLDNVHPLPAAGFTVGDVIRGGRRRRRNRTIVQTAAAVIGVMAVSLAAVTTLGSPDVRKPSPAGPAPSPVVASAPSTIFFSDEELTFTQKGAVVNVSKGSDQVASLTLASAKYTHTSIRAVFTVTSTHPVKIDTRQFAVFIADGDYAMDPKTVKSLDAGTHTFTLALTGMSHEPLALGFNPDRTSVASRDRGSATWKQ
jgi:hypothetical protein